MTRSEDVVGALAALLESCRDGLDVDAGGILVESSGQLQLLASSSHDATELELHQLHVDEGPCIDAHAGGHTVHVHSEEAVRHRWPAFGGTMLAAGFASVHASPLGWNGHTFGAMGLFRRGDVPFTSDEDAIAQAFADIAAMLVIHHSTMSSDVLSRRLQEALETRIVIERAKGVLADQHDLSMADAYDLLVRTSRERQVALTRWATTVVEGAQRSSTP